MVEGGLGRLAWAVRIKAHEIAWRTAREYPPAGGRNPTFPAVGVAPRVSARGP